MGYSVQSNGTISMEFGFTTFSPADATTYYFGTIVPTNTPTTTANIRISKLPRTAILIGAVINSGNLGTLGSGESTTMSLRINNTTDVSLTTSVLYNAATTQVVVGDLNTVITTSDTFEIKMVTPTWVTNPTTIATTVMLLFRF